MEKEELILTVAIFGHACEYLLDPFPESNKVGEFYKKRVRLFSQACVPDMSSVTSDYEHKEIAQNILKKIQDSREDVDTLSILEPYIESCKQEYLKRFEDEKMKSVFDERLFEPKYKTRFCGITTYLANKTFQFYENKPGDSSKSLYGVVLLDVRVKRTSEDGEVEYERVFDAPHVKKPIILTTYDGLLKLLKIYYKQKHPERKVLAPEYNKTIKDTFGLTKTKSTLPEIDLTKLFELLEMFDFVNILDYSCRVCNIKRLRSNEIEDIFEREQKHTKKRRPDFPDFGGKRIRFRTAKKSNKMTKTRKNRKN